MTIKNQGEKIAVSELETKQYEVQVAVTYYFIVEADSPEMAEEIASYDYADDPVAVVIDSIDVYELTTDKKESN
jgi:uncharacterized protein Veg